MLQAGYDVQSSLVIFSLASYIYLFSLIMWWNYLSLLDSQLASVGLGKVSILIKLAVEEGGRGLTSWVLLLTSSWSLFWAYSCMTMSFQEIMFGNFLNLPGSDFSMSYSFDPPFLDSELWELIVFITTSSFQVYSWVLRPNNYFCFVEFFLVVLRQRKTSYPQTMVRSSCNRRNWSYYQSSTYLLLAIFIFYFISYNLSYQDGQGLSVQSSTAILCYVLSWWAVFPTVNRQIWLVIDWSSGRIYLLLPASCSDTVFPTIRRLDSSYGRIVEQRPLVRNRCPAVAYEWFWDLFLTGPTADPFLVSFSIGDAAVVQVSKPVWNSWH